MEVYQGDDEYKDMAGAMMEYEPPTAAQNGTYTLTLTVGDVGTGFRFVMSKNNATNDSEVIEHHVSSETLEAFKKIIKKR